MQVTAEHIINKLPPVEGVKTLLAREQVTDDIITAILNKHNATQSHYDSICDAYWSGNARATGIKLFNFFKDNSTYKAESTKQQTVKVPAAIVADAIAGKRTDCKHYASFIVGVVHALKRKGYPIDARYVFASDDEYKHYPTHVFAEIWDKQGKYWVDPVLRSFNQPHKYYFILKDKDMLYDISGVNEDQQIGLSFNINKPFGDLGRAVTVNIDNLKKGANIAVNDIRKGAINTGKVVITVANAPARNAFLLLVQINTFDMAVKFMEGQRDRSKVQALKNKWLELGGNWTSLVNAINQGYRRSGRNGTFIGFVPIAAAAAAAKPAAAAAAAGSMPAAATAAAGATPAAATAAGGATSINFQSLISAAGPILELLKGIFSLFGINTKEQTPQQKANGYGDLMNKIQSGNGSGTVQTKEDGTQLVTIDVLPRTIYDRKGEILPSGRAGARTSTNKNIVNYPNYVTPESAINTVPLPPVVDQATSAQSSLDFGRWIENVGTWINNNPVPVTVIVGTAAIVAFSNSKIFSPKKR